jgi:hypothetical protein
MPGEGAMCRSTYRDFLALWRDFGLDISNLRQAKSEYAKMQSSTLHAQFPKPFPEFWNALWHGEEPIQPNPHVRRDRLPAEPLVREVLGA